MEIRYPDIEERLLKKEKKTIGDIIDNIFCGLIGMSVIIGLMVLAYFTNESMTIKLNEKLIKKVNTYEQILKYEYNRTFESYEEYIVYRADKIIGE